MDIEEIKSYIQSIIEEEVLLEDTPYWIGDGAPPKQIDNKSIDTAVDKIISMLKKNEIIK